MDDALTSLLNDRLMEAPASYRVDLREYVQARAAQLDRPPTPGELDAFIRHARVYFQIDRGNSHQRRRARLR